MKTITSFGQLSLIIFIFGMLNLVSCDENDKSENDADNITKVDSSNVPDSDSSSEDSTTDSDSNVDESPETDDENDKDEVETPVYKNEFFAAPDGSDSNSGTIDKPFKTIKKGLEILKPGDVLYLKEGSYDEKITFPSSGTSDDERITLRAYKDEKVTITNSDLKTYIVDLDKKFVTLQNIIFDGEWREADIIKIRTEADNAVLKGLEIKNSRRDGIDMTSPKNVVVDGCKIHDTIWFKDGERDDAHGIVTEGVQNLTIKNTEIYYVSGDALQFQYEGWNNILVENCKLWNAPLPSEKAGAPKGKYIGENAVDTKFQPEDGRGKLTLRNITAYGWRSDYISNAAAFNIKHNVEVEIDRVTTYDNEIAFRLRGPGSKGGAHVTLKNAVIYNSDKAVRYEDDIENLKIYNNTFGAYLGKAFESAGGHGDGFEVKNNLFLANSKPEEAEDKSNLGADSTYFIDESSSDYHLSDNSPAIDKGVDLPGVSKDRDGKSRPKGKSHDVGAYEYQIRKN